MALASPGERAETRREASQKKNPGGQEGVKGLRALGVRDLCYRLAFIANSVQVSVYLSYSSLCCQSPTSLVNFYLLVNIGSFFRYAMTERTRTSEIEREMLKMMTVRSSRFILITFDLIISM